MTILVAAFSGTCAFAQGTVIIPEPVPHPRWPNRVTTRPLELKYQRVDVQITDGVAVAEVTQTFRNPLPQPIEGTYVFPLPDDVAVGEFSMMVDGKTLRGEVLDKERARQTYEQIVRRARDPGLLELLGSRLYQASIFPIPPGGALGVKLQYSHPIPERGGLGLFRHPFRFDPHASGPVDELMVVVRLTSTLPLTSVFCPSHKCEVVRPNDHEATITFEQPQAMPDRDFALYYERKDAQFGLSLLTHRPAGEAGYFLLRISPRIELADDQVLPKDVAFVVDASGSMAAQKIEQARRALTFCINSLAPRDRFNVFSFATDVKPFRDTLVPADGEIRSAALEFVSKLTAVGGTNINDALLAALASDPRDDARPYMIVLITDGEPSVAVTDPDQILKNVEARNSRRVRFHVLGVGSKVNTHLLDKLAEINRGTRDYCTENEDLELKLSAFVSRLASPVLTDIRIVLDRLNATDVYPRTPPDLFRGDDVLVLGRYDGEGQRLVKVEGRARGESRVLTYEGEFPRMARENDFLPRLWATRKVAYLLDQIRLHGESRELKDEVVRLATRHGIVTPYTSALILEDERMLAGQPTQPVRRVYRIEAERRAAPQARARYGAEDEGRFGKEGGARFGGGSIAPGAAATGEAAVEASKDLRQLQALGYMSDDADAVRSARGDSPQPIRHVGEKTFVFDAPTQRYLDSTWDGKLEPRKVVAFGDEYFALLAEKPELAPFFALGERVLVIVDGVAYETVPAGP
jgi:Ca-activated chloride channel family protein